MYVLNIERNKTKAKKEHKIVENLITKYKTYIL